MTNSEKPNLRLVDDAEDFEVPEDVADEFDMEPSSSPEPEERLWYGFQEFSSIDKVREYVIKGWLIAHGVTALLAKHGTGKSTVALDLACHLATDRDWWGIPMMRGWKVIYICGEDDEGMILNCRAWEIYHQVPVPNDRFMIAKGIVRLTDAKALRRRLDEMVDWAAGARCLIVLDTWARATSGYSANTQEEMDLAYENAEMVAAALSGPMLACFHPPKKGQLTIRGSAVQEDASSGIWELEEDGGDGSVKLTIGRAKGRGKGNYRKFKLEVIPLPGVDFYKDPLEGIVPVNSGGTEDESRNGIKALEAQREKFRIGQLAYAHLMLTAYLGEPGKRWSVSDMAEAIMGASIEIDGSIVTIPRKATTAAKIVELIGLPVTLLDRGYRVIMTGSSKAGVGGGRQITFEKIARDTGESG